MPVIRDARPACYAMGMLLRILLLGSLLLPGAAQAQRRADSFTASWARAGLLVTLAPACGLRDEAWAAALGRRVASAQQGDVTPAARNDGLAAAALSVELGRRLFGRFGSALCSENPAVPPWHDAASLPAEREDAQPLPALAEPLVRTGWQALIADLALRCDLRDRHWARRAGPGLRRTILLSGALPGDAEARRRLSFALLDQASLIAGTLHGRMLGSAACAGLRRDPDLAAVDEMARQWRRLCRARRPDPSCIGTR